MPNDRPTTIYNLIAGKSRERLAALSDAVFAVAMTLLVLDIRPPELETIRTEQGLAHALLELAPQFLVYLISFMTLGIFWVGQQTQHEVMSRADRNYTWLHLGFLAAVCLVPFSTDLLGEYITLRVAVLVYWLNILLLGALLLASWFYAKRRRLVREDAPPNISDAFVRRVVWAQLLYAIGAALCILSPWLAIVAIFAVQLNYVLAPRIWPFNRL